LEDLDVEGMINLKGAKISRCGPKPVAGPCKHGNQACCNFLVYDTV